MPKNRLESIGSLATALNSFAAQGLGGKKIWQENPYGKKILLPTPPRWGTTMGGKGV
jgi:hypothetical protein